MAWLPHNVVSIAKRFRREDPPLMVQAEDARALPYPLKATLRVGEATFTVNTRRTGWRLVGKGEMPRDQLCISKKVSFYWLVGSSGERVGAARAVLYRFEDFQSNADIAFLLDIDSDFEAEFGSVIATAWPEFTEAVSCYGDVLHVEDVWIAKGAPVETMSALERLLTPSVTEAAMTLIKAFPDEYASRVPPGAPAHLGLHQRESALRRLAERRFGFASFPGHNGAEGWMWRRGHKDIVSAPGYNPTWLNHD